MEGIITLKCGSFGKSQAAWQPKVPSAGYHILVFDH